MKKISKFYILLACSLIFIVSLYLALFKGGTNLSVSVFWDFITGKDTDNSFIFGVLRLPRVIKGIIAGTCLALAGLFMQTITKNPLVEPYITGVSSGAGLALVLGILFNLSPAMYSFLGFAGALTASFIVVFFAGLNRFSLVKLILIGLSINIFTSSVISLLMLTNSEKTHTMMMILSGNLNSSFFEFKPMLIMFALTFLGCLYMIPKLNFLRLDSKVITALSNKTNYYNIFLVFLSAVLAAISVAAAGILGFIGIIIPHLSRILVGIDFRWLFFTNILLGSSLVLISDYLARSVIYPMELPLGLILSLVGAPIFVLFLLIKRRKLV